MSYGKIIEIQDTKILVERNDNHISLSLVIDEKNEKFAAIIITSIFAAALIALTALVSQKEISYEQCESKKQI